MEWLAGILGEYEPPTYDLIYQITDDTTIVQHVIPDGAAGLDWQYVICGVLLVITIYSVFRLLGVLLERFFGR